MYLINPLGAADADFKADALVSQIEKLSKEGGLTNYTLAVMEAAKLQFTAIKQTFQYSFLLVALEFNALYLSGVSYDDLFGQAAAYTKQSLMTPVAIFVPSLAVQTADSSGIRQKQLWQRIKKRSSNLYIKYLWHLNGPVALAFSGLGLGYLSYKLTVREPQHPDPLIKNPSSYAPLLFCAMPLVLGGGFGGGYGLGKCRQSNQSRTQGYHDPLPKEFIRISIPSTEEKPEVPKIEVPIPDAPIIGFSGDPIGGISLEDALTASSAYRVDKMPGTFSAWVQEGEVEHLVYFTNSGQTFIFFDRVIRGKLLDGHFCLHGYSAMGRPNTDPNAELNNKYHLLYDLFLEYQIRVLKRSKLKIALDNYDGDKFIQLKWNLIAANAANKDEAARQLERILSKKYSEEAQKKLQLEHDLFDSLDLMHFEGINSKLAKDRQENGAGVALEEMQSWQITNLSAIRTKLLEDSKAKLDRFNRQKGLLKRKIFAVENKMILSRDKAQKAYDEYCNQPDRKELESKLNEIRKYKKERDQVFAELNKVLVELNRPMLDIRLYSSPVLEPVPFSPRRISHFELDSGVGAPPISPRSMSFEHGELPPSISPRATQNLGAPLPPRQPPLIPSLELDKITGS